nr:PAS domain-containing protein [Aneurinibacillus terranovensis]
MLVFTPENIRPIHSISTDMSLSAIQAYLHDHKEPIVFVKKKDELLGYVRTQDILTENAEKTSEIPFLQANLIPLHFVYHVYVHIAVSDFFKLLGEEFVIVKNQQDEVCGYLRREDIIIELLRQDNDNIDLFRTILSSIPLGIFVLDKQGYIINYNEEGLRMIKWKADKLPSVMKAEKFSGRHRLTVFLRPGKRC